MSTVKPTPEAKALSLFLMAYKTKDPKYKETSKRINKMWDLVMEGEISRTNYNDEILNLLTSFGGYAVVVEKTVRFYIKKTGVWKLKGEDKYCEDAQKVADEILKK